MCDALNIMARVDEKPDMTCSFKKFHGRPCRRAVHPCMMPGHHKVKRAVKLKLKGEPLTPAATTHRTASRSFHRGQAPQDT